MRQLSMGALLLCFALPLSAAECIEVSKEEFDLSTNDIGSAVMQWSAELKNACRTTMDADLLIHLVDKEDEPVYELLDKTTLGVEESVTLEKEVYVPSRIVDRVQGFRIQVQERERLQ